MPGCSHFVHAECGAQWLAGSPTCVVCNRNVKEVLLQAERAGAGKVSDHLDENREVSADAATEFSLSKSIPADVEALLDHNKERMLNKNNASYLSLIHI